MEIRNLIIIFALLFNICHTNNNSFKDKSRFGATFLTAVLNSHRSGANFKMKLIPLSQNSKKHRGKYFAKVDDSDYEWLMQWKWSAHIMLYTIYAERTCKVTGRTIKMHRAILGLTDPKIFGEHKNGNGLDNQRLNLRPATPQQNSQNKRKIVAKGNTSKYIGVHFVLHHGHLPRWRADITVGGKQTLIGYYKNEIDAAIARDEKAKELHGEFAGLNFKDGTPCHAQKVKGSDYCSHHQPQAK